MYSPVIISAKERVSLQTQIEGALLDGHEKIILEGEFFPTNNEQFSLITIEPNQKIEIIGTKNTTLDGKGKILILS